jgi:HEAT repeat protein
MELLKSAEPKERRAAADTLGEMGTAAKAAIPVLIAVLEEDPEAGVRETAAAALVDVGPTSDEAVAALVRALTDTDHFVRCKAAAGLSVIGAPAIRRLTVALQQGDTRLRIWAACALGRMEPPGKPGMQDHLAAFLNGDNVELASEAAYALGLVAERVPGAAGPLLRALAQSGHPGVRLAASIALAPSDRGAPAEGAITALIAALEDPDASVREATVIIWGHLTRLLTRGA